MKIANIIVAHKNPGQLLRLIQQFDGEHFHNYVHVDAKADITQFAAVANHPNVTMMPRLNVVWAGWSQVQVSLDALTLARQSKNNYKYFNLISGMDFPIRSTIAFHDFLEEQYKQGPREFFEIRDLSVWPGAHRFERFHLNEMTMKGRYFLERIINWFVPKRKFWGGRMTAYGYSTWFTASDKFIDYAFRFFEENPGFIRFLKTTWSPDEFIFNTLVMNSPFKDKLWKGNLRYIDFSERKVSPKVFTAADMNTLTSSGEFLARKFDEAIDSKILDELEIIIKSETPTFNP